MLKLYVTEIKAINRDGDITTYCGPYVPGMSFQDAEDYCDRNGLGYCQVTGVLEDVRPLYETTTEFLTAELLRPGRVLHN